MLKIILILFLFLSRIFAQEVTLKGYVVDEEYNPVKNSVIELIQSNSIKTTVSDSLGFFRFKIAPGEVKIISKHLGYNRSETTLKVFSDTSIFIRLSSRVIKFNEVTVTATRYQANTAEISNFVEIVNIETIKKTPSITLTDILKNATSIYIRDYGGTPAVLKTISLRGTGSEHTVFLLNGMRISSYQNGIFDLSLIPIHLIERIEIIHSNLSSLYGADAVGGVVNIITRKENEGKIAEVNFAFDSFGLKKLNTNLSGTIKSLSLFSSLSRTYGPGDFEYKYKLADKHLTLKRKNAHFNISDLYLNISNDNFTISTFYIRSNRGIPAQVTKYDPSSTANQFDEDFNFLISTSKTLSSLILK
ncbi:MAG: TonB-dependent receptor plug domain-containing protein, partial [Candidatus Kryptonium sp.]